MIIKTDHIATLEKYGLGAAARNYTRNLKAEFIREIASKYI